MKELLIKIIRLKIEYFSLLLKYHMNQTENSKKIYAKAKELLGSRVAPYDARSKYGVLGCAMTVSIIIYRATDYPIGGDGFIEGTPELYKCLLNDTHFTKVDKPLPGDIRLGVTGTGNGRLSNAHAGIDGYHGVMSNNSDNGRLQQKISFEEWKQLYEIFGGYTTHYFRML